MCEWVSVEDRLPCEEGNYIVFTEEYLIPTHQNINGAFYRAERGTWSKYMNQYPFTVTHWMPFPEPPDTEPELARRFDEEAQQFEDRLNEAGWQVEWQVLRYAEMLANRDGLEPGGWGFIVRSRLAVTDMKGKDIVGRKSLPLLTDEWIKAWVDAKCRHFLWTRAEGIVDKACVAGEER